MQTPSSKHQTPDKLQTPFFKRRAGQTQSWLDYLAWCLSGVWILVFAVFSVGELGSRELGAAEFRVGFSQADITPPVGWRRAGNYTELISTGVNDPLMTKAMVVQEGATTFAFVGNDLCSVPRDLTDLARERASKLTGIPAANIVITATHTHGGPEYLGPLRQFLHERAKQVNGGRDPHEPIDYRAQLVERWAGVIANAWSNRQPASLEVVIPRLEGVAHNRRYWMKDGSVGWIPRKGDTNIFRPAGPVDTDFPFLLARRVVGQTSSLKIRSASVPR